MFILKFLIELVFRVFFKWFWIGYGMVLVKIINSFNFKIYVLYLYRYMANILEIIECSMTDKWQNPGIQNHSKNVQKTFKF